MLEEILRSIRNFFVLPGGIYTDSFTVENGSVMLPFLAEGQHFRIIGSVFNDGVYQYPVVGLQDERFAGSIWALAIPPDFLKLAGEIEQWQEKNGDAGPYQSESFAGYSYTIATGKDGQALTWQDAFRKRLNVYRKI